MSTQVFERAQLVLGDPKRSEITNLVSDPLERFPSRLWFFAISITSSMLLLGLICIGYSLYWGIGVWGNNIPAAWGFPIVNFVFWIGIGHAGTLISAILYLFRQRWRTAINRAAEAMTIFAVMCAGIFPLIHVGRPWLAYWLFPIPNQQGIWVNFRSPLLWDVFAVSTYFTVSLLFWYIGLIPDIATLRDRTSNPIKKVVYSILALGWRSSQRHWKHYETTYLIFAAISTPLVLSVHSIVSFDFAVSIVPGWHTTIFPPYFVAGAIFGGFAMVEILLVLTRKLFKLENIITLTHLENMNKILLVAGMIVGYAYFVEFFTAWYSGSTYEIFAFMNRAFGAYGWAYWLMVFCNVIAVQVFWSRSMRRSIPVMITVSILITIGMWFERFVIIITSLTKDFLPSSWGMYYPTFNDIGIFIGTLGLFFTLYLLFVRVLPAVAISEIKGVMKNAHPRGEVDDV
ncbi:MAG: hydrogenase [Deltaproteobacteria bacterium RIFCSPHIGHO2_02_FULL_40_11]|nr:MAG: hydrogenase [Deltaproteobacteria bacterium RIFCSPHIGHO2_02_FULL_40_11]